MIAVRFTAFELGYIRSQIRRSAQQTEWGLRSRNLEHSDRETLEQALATERGILAKFDEQEARDRALLDSLERKEFPRG